MNTLELRIRGLLDENTTTRQIDDGGPSVNGIVGVTVTEIDDEDALVRGLVSLFQEASK